MEYTDLLLDVLMPAGGEALLLDEDELAEAVATGHLDEPTAADGGRIAGCVSKPLCISAMARQTAILPRSKLKARVWRRVVLRPVRPDLAVTISAISVLANRL